MDYDSVILNLMECCANITQESDDQDDGRLSSALNEKATLKQIEKYALDNKINIVLGKPREWFDFQFGNVYFNLKLTAGGTDNIFNKTAVIYSITGQIPNNKNMGFNTFMAHVEPKHWKQNRDLTSEYHYLIYHKIQCCWLIVRLMDIIEYKTNPCNILQVNWNNEFSNNAIDTLPWNKKIIRLLKTIQTSIKQDIKSKMLLANYEFDLINKFASLRVADV